MKMNWRDTGTLAGVFNIIHTSNEARLLAGRVVVLRT